MKNDSHSPTPFQPKSKSNISTLGPSMPHTVLLPRNINDVRIAYYILFIRIQLAKVFFFIAHFLANEQINV